ncbi:hypothetical protein L916_13978 [Phytophthora nicotianae]|uniref:Uncharacterized protein n=1 Tax=Phytophthora nicotianae TaxID=4792 RepID=W2IHH8_PHYNI|nr:hypothetical protein L916_13978 [Phytophthora nicotianae]
MPETKFCVEFIGGRKSPETLCPESRMAVLKDAPRARGDLLLDQEFKHGCFSMLAQGQDPITIVRHRRVQHKPVSQEKLHEGYKELGVRLLLLGDG